MHRLRFLAALTGVLLFGTGWLAAAEGGFSFEAPPGWRLVKGRSPRPTRHSYFLQPATTDRLSCGVGVGGEDRGRSIEAYQQSVADSTSRLGRTVPPAPPKILRSELQTRSGLRLTKAEVRYTWFRQPGLRRGPITEYRCFLYTFRDSRGRIRSLNCFLPTYGQAGTFFDAALDDLARSIVVRR